MSSVLAFACPFALRGGRSAPKRNHPASSLTQQDWAGGIGSSGTLPRPPGTALDVPALRDDVSAPARARGGVGAAGLEALTLR